MYKLAVFDLDGTVLATMEDLALAVNAARADQGLAPQDTDYLQSLVGNGIRRVIVRCTEGGKADHERMYRFFNSYYPEHCLDNTYPYDGITEVLTELKEAGIILAVNTNKPHEAAVKLIDTCFPGLFDIVEGQKEGLPIKPDPAVLRKIMERSGADISNTVYIGDSEVDIMTAENAGVTPVSVTWGFKTTEFLREHGAKVLADHPSALRKILL